MGIFGLLNAYGSQIIPQIGWLYELPWTALKYIPQHLLDSVPSGYPLHGFYTNIVAFFNQLLDVAVNLPVVGFYIDSILSITLIQIVLPVTIVSLVEVLLLVKLIKLIANIIPL